MKGRRLCFFAFLAYCALMLWLLSGRPQDDSSININPVPFETIAQFWRILVGDYGPGLKRHAVINLVGNVIMFVPLGFLTALLWRTFRPFWRCAVLGGGIIVCVELIQMLTRVGSCDFDDLLLNVIGISAGYGLNRLFGRRICPCGK